jgi:SPP1 family predicted phage head-tail adaptor
MVTIQRYEKVSNGMGGYFQQWSDYLPSYGYALDQLSGDEFVKADKTFPGSTHVLIGEVTDITEADRVLVGNKIYNIKNVDNPMNLDRHLEILLEYKGVRE